MRRATCGRVWALAAGLLGGTACGDEQATSSPDAAGPRMGATRDMGVAVADAGVPLWMDDASSGTGGAGGNDAPSGGAGGGGADVPPPAGGAGSGGEPSGGAPADRDSGTPPAGPDANVQACALNVTPANGAARPTDILWFIDASPSMRAEIETVAANLNAFADRIAGAGIDYHVVIVGPDQQIYPQRDAQEFFPICVPPPLSARAGCPDTDSERYLHVRRPLHSREALAVGLDALPEYRRFLRPGAATHVVVVTDDDERGSNPNADEFDAAFAPVAPGYKLHSIVDFVGYIDGCGVFGDECSCGERRGQVYIDLSERTGGEVQSICEPDWSPIFAALEASVVEAARLPCAYTIPEPPPGVELEPDRLNVSLTDGAGRETELFQVDGEAGCRQDPLGWYYDDPAAPTQVRLCADACGDREGSVDITFGCVVRKR